MTLAVAVLAAPLAAQDGLVVSGRWMGAVGQFGQDLGLAPPEAAGPSIRGGNEFGGGRPSSEVSLVVP